MNIKHFALALLPALLLVACSKKDGGSVYETSVVQRETLATTVTATGTVEPADTVTVGTQVSGIIDKIYVDYNSVVKKGQIIAELDRSTLEADYLSGKADVDASAAEVKYQEATYKRQKELFEKNVISDTEMELAEYNYAQAKASYDKAKAALIKLERNVGYATIYSPIDGIVLSRDVEEGETVASSYSTPELFTIAANLTSMTVIADVDEADIGGVSVDQEVTFTVDAYPDDTFKGVVKQIRLSPTTSSSVVTYEVVITVDNSDMKLLPGLTATVTIVTNYSENALCVPREALEFKPTPMEGMQIVPAMADPSDKHSAVVYVKHGNKIEGRVVTKGMKTNVTQEIISGVSEGDTVVIGQRTIAVEVPSNDSNENASPFMPQPPGSNKKK